jgi:mRNA-degrading endonuclease RelE of RelBE toxin-antitoxin system
MYKIYWKPKAARQLEKIRDKKTKMAIFDSVDTLSGYPNCANIKILKNHKYDFRLRVGKFRVLCSIKEIVEIIDIEEVKKRDENTY